MKERLKIGYAPTRRFTFSKEDAHRFKKMTLETIAQFDIDIVDLEGINPEGLLFDNDEDAKKIIKRFKEADVDAVFFPHCNFGTEDTVAKVARALKRPVLLWGPRDEAPLSDGSRLRDTQCGLFATGKVLRRFNVPYTYIINSALEDPVFTRGFKNFIAVVNVVKKFRNIRILQISTRPAGFWTMICNEGELLEKFGVEIYPVSLQEIKDLTEQVERDNGKDLQETVDLIQDKMDCSEVNAADIKRVAALKAAI